MFFLNKLVKTEIKCEKVCVFLIFRISQKFIRNLLNINFYFLRNSINLYIYAILLYIFEYLNNSDVRNIISKSLIEIFIYIAINLFHLKAFY